jgi:S-DNA-T family DNA segregation ATPase FtsK/SpoIIIE
MTGVQLRTRLEHKYGVKVASTGNRYPLDPAVIREALIRRAIEGDE